MLLSGDHHQLGDFGWSIPGVSTLKSVGRGVVGVGKGVVKGVGSGAAAVGRGVGSGASAVGHGVASGTSFLGRGVASGITGGASLAKRGIVSGAKGAVSLGIKAAFAPLEYGYKANKYIVTQAGKQILNTQAAKDVAGAAVATGRFVGAHQKAFEALGVAAAAGGAIALGVPAPMVLPLAAGLEKGILTPDQQQAYNQMTPQQQQALQQVAADQAAAAQGGAGEIISGVPNWALAAGGAALALVLFMPKRSSSPASTAP